MRILVIGGGGREHALAWKLARSPRVQEVICAPGNAGTAAEPKVTNAPVADDDLDGLLRLARREAVDLTVVGPEAPLVAGVVDRFEAAGLRCFGPSAAAARLEGSKAFAKDFMARHAIPTAAYGTFTDSADARAFVERLGRPVAVKADGLAAGKGVVLADDAAEANAAVEEMLGGRFGGAGARVVVEERLEGEEASFLCLVDGEHILPLASSQDHKTLNEGDTGPNTGGMGAYSPAPVVTGGVAHRVMEEVVRPTVAGMAAEGTPFRGVLYAGLMIHQGRPRVLEFNCRFGDPECQPLMMRLRSDLAALLEKAAEGRLDANEAAWDPRPALTVVQAAGGYPGAYEKGHPIDGLDAVPEGDQLKVFHAGTARGPQGVVTAGGRVLGITALGASVAEARDRALGAADRIRWPGVYYRRDIGHRALGRG
ncbi:phosphoribosylamine--glycine ligase [Thiohalorhabdus denitrificans]|uniref:Phosphoribosylamine--glycine ligase n=1 Tax=Thiohalorhabdus denitrificans TaxID=381306 RepID=A0A0P9C4K5_9GAMM|nr:phosphoribosylamine--glycine ligase [Thiohalorhabdus denitrificans]KPV39736.1 phosphoribosylamine--glycine ligase [Thiohalorhabdus denitrificans]SCX91610.1 phosphoribosylamine--glycine ligase [Thiohalorhabdus denitrificans]